MLAQTPPAKGFFWAVERDGRTSWLVGSLHVLTRDAYPLPAPMEQAFDRSTTLVEEADVDDIASPGLMAAVATRGLIMNGPTLDTLLGPDLFKQLVTRLTAVGLPGEMARMMRPWMAQITLAAGEIQRAGLDPEFGIDVHFRRRAEERKIPLRPLETAAEQIEYLASLPDAVQLAGLRDTIVNGDQELKQVQAIVAAWRSGDAAAIERQLVDSMKDAPEYYDALVVQRNRRWLPKIEPCLAAGNCFIVVGAAHMVGSDGLVSLLRARGYRVTQR